MLEPILIGFDRADAVPAKPSSAAHATAHAASERTSILDMTPLPIQKEPASTTAGTYQSARAKSPRASYFPLRSISSMR